MISSASLQIPSQDSSGGPRPVSAAVQPSPPPPSSSRRQQRASHTVVSGGQSGHHGGSSRDDTPAYTDVYSHPAAVAYATAHPRRTIPKFGPYLLLQTLGEGEFGKVKLGLHSQWGEEVAVKLIRRGNVDNSVRMSKVEREIEVLRTLKHPNIVRLYDVIETDKYIGIILEYASGGELFDHILAHRYLRERDAAKLFSQLISGVWYIHQKKIVHRDLKLENLLLDRHRNVIITDFGFANRFEHRSDDLMQTSCGSPCYAAPELVISEGLYVGSAVDIWSCGVILYAMLAGYLPFDDDPANPDGDNINLLYKYIVNTPLSFPEYISAEARDLLGMMLVPDPTRRSSLDAVMRHPWLSGYAMPKDTSLPPPAPGVPIAFGRSVDQLERAALDQHQQRRLAYQRQMRATSTQGAQQQQAVAAPVGRTQSHHIPTGGSGSGHRQAATEGPSPGGRSQSTQPEFLYDSSVDLSINASPASRRHAGPSAIAGGDDDPFGPPPSASAGKAAMLAADAAPSPKGHKVNGGGSGSGGGFRHTIQVEYDEPRTHGRSGSQGQSTGGRRSEDREGRHEQQPQQSHRDPQQQQQTPQRQNGVPPVVSPVPKERRPSQGSVKVSPTKPLPSPPPSATANGTIPSSYRGLPTPSTPTTTQTSPKIPSATPTRASTRSSHARTPSTPVASTPTTTTPNISVAAASPPGTPIIFSSPDASADIEVEDRVPSSGTGTGSRSQKAGRASLDKLVGLGKMLSGGSSSAASTATAATGDSSPGRVPSESGRSGRSGSRSSVLLSPSAEKKEKGGKEGKKEEGKKSRRNTLTVMVEPFRSTIRGRSAKGRAPGSAEASGAVTPDGKEKPAAKALQPPHSALVRSGGEKTSAGPAQSFAGATGEIGHEGGGAGMGMQASTSKARKVMAWFRGRSRVRDGAGSVSADEEEEPKTGQRSSTPTQAAYGGRGEEGVGEKKRGDTLPVHVVVTTPTASTTRMPSSASSYNHPKRTPSTATADTSFTATTSGTPSLVTRFRNSVTIGGRDRDRDRDAHHHHTSAVSAPPVPQHPWGALRTHHGAVDQSTITTKPPPEVIRHVRAVLEGMGVEIQVESEYKYRCLRAKRRKGSMIMGGASTPPSGALGNVGAAGGAGGSLAAVTMVGSAASNGVDKRGLPLPSPSSFSAPGGMLRGLLMRRQSSQVSSTGLASPLDDDIPSPLATEPGVILGATTYGDPAQDAGDEVKFSVELTRIDRLTDTFSLDIRRMKGNLRSYKFLYDTLRDRADLQR
ncbi:CAMK/CAMKL/Kin4 protein kinase [Lyophyllum atratum]|nr:CAMK/CAMKL/Kin4 protein kinase [Lyophyllum atratum]